MGQRRTCSQPDRDVPKLRCGYPLPCPWHTVVVDLGSDPPGKITTPLARILTAGQLTGIQAIRDALLAKPTFMTTARTYHYLGCRQLRRSKKAYPWTWANDQPGFDPVAFGRLACGGEYPEPLRLPCLVCFPELREPCRAYRRGRREHGP